MSQYSNTRRIQKPFAAPATLVCTSSSWNTVVTPTWKRKNKYTSVVISDSAFGNSRAEFRSPSHTDAAFPPAGTDSHWGHWAPHQLPSEISVWAPPLAFPIRYRECFTNHFFQSFHSCQAPPFFVCFKSHKAVSSPACSSLAIPSVPAMVGNAAFHFRSLQRCRWNLLDHRAANATKETFWLQKSALGIFISVSQVDQFVAWFVPWSSSLRTLRGTSGQVLSLAPGPKHLSHWSCRHSKLHRFAPVLSMKASICESPVLPAWPIWFPLYQKSCN